tara:strand:+ start:5861 stop:6004 length:144 start_codon:yes stop_codon:yes gene_type:complete
MTIGHGILLLVIGLTVSVFTLWAIIVVNDKFEKQREKDENTTTDSYR